MKTPGAVTAYLILVHRVRPITSLVGNLSATVYLGAFIARSPAEDLPVRDASQLLSTVLTANGGNYTQAYANVLAKLARSPYRWMAVKDDGPLWVEVSVIKEDGGDGVSPA